MQDTVNGVVNSVPRSSRTKRSHSRNFSETDSAPLPNVSVSNADITFCILS